MPLRKPDNVYGMLDKEGFQNNAENNGIKSD